MKADSPILAHPWEPLLALPTTHLSSLLEAMEADVKTKHLTKTT
jgi:hypothetical protein